MTRDERVKRAKTQLIIHYPFIGNILFGMEVVWDTCVPTAGTNGLVIILNPDYVDSLNDDELKFLLAHETFHPMFDHCTRLEGRDPYKWNQAGDYLINQTLIDDSVGSMPQGGLYDRDIYAQGNGTTDGIYNILPNTPKNQQGMGGEGQPLDDCLGEGLPEKYGTPKTQADKDRLSAQWKVKVSQSANATKVMGKMTDGLERLVGQLLKPKVDWRDVLMNYLVRCKIDLRRLGRPNRRFITQGMYLPSVSGEAMGELVCAVDCSGSISQDEIDQFSAEVTKVWEDLLPTRLHVVYFDYEVCHHDEFNRGDEVVIKPHGGCGTAFSPVFKYLDKKQIEPVACVFLTDLVCNDFGTEPSYPVLWVNTLSNDTKVPFGETVEMHNEQ